VIDAYLAKIYPKPPCWHLVADIYRKELGISVIDFTPETDNPLAVANAFRIALHEGRHGFAKVERADNFAVVLLGRSKPTHCGVWYDDGVIHAMGNITIWQPVAQIKDRFQLMEYWVRNGKN